jgi:hypothetical protein
MRTGKLVVDSRLDELQSKHRLILSIDNSKAHAYLKKIKGVASVSTCNSEHKLSHYVLEASTDIAPRIVKAVIKAGDNLYTLRPEIHNLENLFAELNADINAAKILQEVA